MVFKQDFALYTFIYEVTNFFVCFHLSVKYTINFAFWAMTCYYVPKIDKYVLAHFPEFLSGFQ